MPVDDFADLIAISRFAGERFDLVQAGGGNTSQRFDDGRLYVKASGMALSAVKNIDEFCCVSWRPLLDFLDQADAEIGPRELEKQANEVVGAAVKTPGRRPSIETLLHCALGNLTLHTHPIAVTTVACAGDWKERLSALFPDGFFVDYKTPGPALALALRKQLVKRDWKPGDTACIFLQNHGLIVAGARKSVVIQITNDVVDRIAGGLAVNFDKYKLVNFTSQLVNTICGSELVSYLSEDQKLMEAAAKTAEVFLTPPLTPDQLVYCGPAALVLESQDQAAAAQAVRNYLQSFRQPPRVVIVKGKGEHHVLILGQSLHKCKETEDVLKSVVIMLDSAKASAMQFLSQDEVDYLSNWEAEKYRQKL